MVWPYDERGRLVGENVWEYDDAERAVIKLDPDEVLTTQQAAELLEPQIKPLPPFEESLLPAREFRHEGGRRARTQSSSSLTSRAPARQGSGAPQRPALRDLRL